MSASISDVEVAVNRVVERGVAHVVGLYSLLYSSRDYARRNIIATLEPAFGPSTTSEVCSELEKSLKDIDMSAKVKIEDREVSIGEYLGKIHSERTRIKDYT